MKVQEIDIAKGKRWVLLDSDYRPVREANRFLKYLDAKNFSPNTLKTYCYGLKRFYEYLEATGTDLFDVYRDDGIAVLDLLVDFTLYTSGAYGSNVVYLNGPPNDVSDSSLNSSVTAILGIYEYLTLEHGYRDLGLKSEEISRWTDGSFLSELVHSRKYARRRAISTRRCDPDIEYVTREEALLLVSSCTFLRDKLLVDLLFNTGMRISEALGLRISDLCLEDGRIDIVFRDDNENGARVKNYAQRSVFPPKPTIDLCRDYLIREALEFESDYLFLSLRGASAGRALSYGAAYKALAKAGRRAGIRFHPHMLRHGYAVERLEDGYAIEDIALLMGHKNIGSTRIYLSVTKKLARERLRPMVEDVSPLRGG